MKYGPEIEWNELGAQKGELPPLPEPHILTQRGTEAYTENQMREYGKLCQLKAPEPAGLGGLAASPPPGAIGPAVGEWRAAQFAEIMARPARSTSPAPPSAEAGAVAPIGWVFQHGETGRMTFCENDGINTPEVFQRLNPGHTFCGPAYTHAATMGDDVTLRKYEALIYAVGNKYPGESRHETALRYIRQAESSGGESQAALSDRRGGDK